MSAKPSVLPAWATSGAVVVPSAAKQAKGWVPGEKPPAEYMNWILVTIYAWIVWLNDGDVALHNVTASGTLAVTGASAFTGVSTFAGLVNANGGISVPTGQTVVLNGTTPLTVVADVTTQGRFRHGTRTIVLPACSFVISDGTASISGVINSAGFITAAGASTMYSRVSLESGKTITGVTVFYNPNGGGNVTPKLRRINISTGAASDVWLGSADNTGVIIESQTNAPNHVVLSTDGYQIEVAVSGAANRVHGAIITYTD